MCCRKPWQTITLPRSSPLNVAKQFLQYRLTLETVAFAFLGILNVGYGLVTMVAVDRWVRLEGDCGIGITIQCKQAYRWEYTLGLTRVEHRYRVTKNAKEHGYPWVRKPVCGYDVSEGGMTCCPLIVATEQWVWTDVRRLCPFVCFVGR